MFISVNVYRFMNIKTDISRVLQYNETSTFDYANIKHQILIDKSGWCKKFIISIKIDLYI